MIKFHFMSGDVNYTTYGGKWISNRQNNGEFDYWFVIELINWQEAVGDRDAPDATYNVSLSVVSPSQAGEQNLKAAYECCGITQDILDTAKANGYLEEAQVEFLHSYGVHTPVWDQDGNNYRALLQQARAEAREVGTLFGFYMDRPVNKIGETGWESLKGTDPREVLERVLQENPSPETKLVAKISGLKVD